MRSLPSRPSSGVALLLLSLFVAASLVLVARHAHAAVPHDDFDRQIRAELSAVDPSAVAVLDAADKARDANDLDAAARGYEEVRRRAPAFFHATRRLCGVELARGDRTRALELCREALGAKETPENHSALAFALVSGKGTPSPSDVRSADFHARRAAQDKPEDVSVQQVVCSVALANNDTNALATCSAAIVRLDTKDPSGHFYASISAATRGDFDAAESELERARALGLPEPAYENLRTKLSEAKPKGPVVARFSLLTVVGWFAFFGLLFVVGSLLSASALRAASRMPDERTAEGGHARGVDALLRKAYRVVLWVACAFYYVSLPLLVVLIVVGTLAIGYAALAIGHIPVKLLLIVGIAAIVTVGAILKSLFVRVTDTDPGEKIDLGAHPRLRAALDEVAGRIGTRPVDAVYLTPFTDVAVLERGGIAKQMRGDTERALVLGAGVLEGLKVRAFKGVLAHEYGHFHNEDTAGGGFALAVRRSILAMAIGLAQGGAASNINPAWWFVKGFYSVFLRISQGASRLQEVLADRWAAFAYGSKAFEDGLRHVVRRSLAFDAHAEHTLNEVVEGKLALANLYRYVPTSAAPEGDLEEAFDKAWSAEPSPYDSHPRPADRIAWVTALATEGTAPVADDDAEDAWTLFSDRAAVEEQMTAIVRARVAMTTGVALPDA